MLIECLTGERVFPGSGLETAAARLSVDPPVPSDVSTAWQSLLRDMTAREPGDRPTAADVAARLRVLPADEGLEPTRRFDAVDSPETQPMQPEGVDVATERFSPATATRSAPGRQAAPAASDPPRRRVLVGVGVALAAATVVGLTWWGVTSQTPMTPDTKMTYPPVEGELGTSLELLQRSVEP